MPRNRSCEICGSLQCTYRSYAKQWICFTCRLLPDQLYLTMTNMMEKYKIPKVVLLVAYMIKHHPTKSLIHWTFKEDESRLVTQMKLRNYKGLDIITLPNPHLYDDKKEQKKQGPLIDAVPQVVPPEVPCGQPPSMFTTNSKGERIHPMKLFKDVEVKELCQFLFGNEETERRIQQYKVTHDDELQQRRDYQPRPIDHVRYVNQKKDCI